MLTYPRKGGDGVALRYQTLRLPFLYPSSRYPPYRRFLSLYF
jgi:hypothetical protein